MKYAIDENNEIVEVEDNVTVKTINGTHYLLNEQDLQEIAEREAAYLATVVEETRLEAIKQVDLDAEQERLKYITGGAGQAMAYLKQEAEAKQFVNDSEPLELNYPHIYAKVGTSDGATAMEVAETFLQNASIWGVVSAHIEGVRKRAKDAIMVAETVEAIRSASEVNFSLEV